MFPSMAMLVWCKKKDKRKGYLFWMCCTNMKKKCVCCVTELGVRWVAVFIHFPLCVSNSFIWVFVFCPFRDHEAKNSALAAHSLSCHYLLQYTSSSHMLTISIPFHSSKAFLSFYNINWKFQTASWMDLFSFLIVATLRNRVFPSFEI